MGKEDRESRWGGFYGRNEKWSLPHLLTLHWPDSLTRQGRLERHLVVTPREGRSRLGDQLARLRHRAFLWDWYMEVEVLNWGHVSLEHQQPSFLDAEGKCDLLEEK